MHIYFTHIKCKFMLHTKDDFASRKNGKETTNHLLN